MVGDHPAVDCCLHACVCSPVRGTDRRANPSLFYCFFLTSFFLDRNCIFNGPERSIECLTNSGCEPACWSS